VSFGSIGQGFGVVASVVLYIGIYVPISALLSLTASSGLERTGAVTTKRPVRIFQILQPQVLLQTTSDLGVHISKHLFLTFEIVHRATPFTLGCVRGGRMFRMAS
jgi:hypothetical protein